MIKFILSFRFRVRFCCW